MSSSPQHCYNQSAKFVTHLWEPMKNLTKVRLALWGCGNMGPIILQYALDKGAGEQIARHHVNIRPDIVGVIDRNPNRVKKTVEEVTTLPIKGITIIPPEDADYFFNTTPVDVCIVATRTAMSDIANELITCANHKVNAITLSEEATYPYTTSPDVTKAIDAAAKRNGVTVFGSGYTDWAWVVFPVVMAGSMHKISRIEGVCQYNVNDYGSALCSQHGVGLTSQEFEEQISKPGNMQPCYGWNSNEGIAAALGLTITRISQRIVPTFADKPVFCKVLSREIPVGYCTGMQAIATVETAEGVTIVFNGIGKVYTSEDTDTNDWTISGEGYPTLAIKTPGPPTVEMTCSVAVNRIPQVLNAKPGFLTADKLGPPRYLAHPMTHYISAKL